MISLKNNKIINNRYFKLNNLLFNLIKNRIDIDDNMYLINKLKKLLKLDNYLNILLNDNNLNIYNLLKKGLFKLIIKIKNMLK